MHSWFILSLCDLRPNPSSVVARNRAASDNRKIAAKAASYPCKNKERRWQTTKQTRFPDKQASKQLKNSTGRVPSRIIMTTNEKYKNTEFASREIINLAYCKTSFHASSAARQRRLVVWQFWWLQPFLNCSKR
jgi:hypothetical protein